MAPVIRFVAGGWHVAVSTHALLLALGVCAATVVALRRAPDRRLLAAWAAPLAAAVLAGSGLLYGVLHPGPIAWRAGGLSSMGGAAALAAMLALAGRLSRAGIAPLADAVAPAALVGLAVGRVGCFLAGCCWGRPTDLPWGVTFPELGPPARHPLQLYAAAADLLAAAVAGRPALAPGLAVARAAAGFGGARLALEALRDPAAMDPPLAGVATGWLGALVALAGGALAIRRLEPSRRRAGRLRHRVARDSAAPRVAPVIGSRKDRPPMPPAAEAHPLPHAPGQQVRAAVMLPWLTRLRWGGVAGQLVTVAVGHWTLGLELPLVPVLALIGFTVLTNLTLSRWVDGGGTASPALCGGVLAVDIVVLTGLLFASGGPFNPFSVLYLVYIMLAAVVLGAAWTWSLAGLAVACYVSLFLLPTRGDVPHVHGAGSALALHLWGMLVAFVVAAMLTAYFVVKLSAAIEQRDAEIAAMRDQATRRERLASLTTLAAGAAHELGTPLGTIAVAARELERAVAHLDEGGAAALRDDARLIRGEVERCRQILDRMATDSGEATGEAPTLVTVAGLVGDVLDTLPPDQSARIRVAATLEPAVARLPRRAVASAVANLLRNALDASAPPDRVELRIDADERALRVTVRDEGPGMTPEVLAHAVEPFFSTKPPGRGMGLGLFLVRTLAEELGGRLVIRSAPGAGAEAELELPRGLAVEAHGAV